MREFAGKVAVVTGAASGIGRGLAERAAHEGMKVVLADVEEEALATVAGELRQTGAQVLAVRTDVSRLEDVKALADQTLSAFGAVHLLCNNAGVNAGTNIWNSTIADWQWVLGVNLWGVIHGLHVFVPIMLDQNTEGHIVNTASIAGLTAGPGLGLYKATKHAVVSISETLYHELALNNAKIKVTALCPTIVNTRLGEAERNRPALLKNDPSAIKTDAVSEAARARLRDANIRGMTPAEAADIVFRGIRDETLYVITAPWPELLTRIEERAKNIIGGNNPTVA